MEYVRGLHVGVNVVRCLGREGETHVTDFDSLKEVIKCFTTHHIHVFFFVELCAIFPGGGMPLAFSKGVT